MGKAFLQAGGSLSQNSGATAYYVAANSRLAAGTTELYAQNTFRTAGVFSNLYVRISANTLNGTTTYKTRKNGADGAQSVSFLTTVTGSVEDTTNTDSVSIGDEFNYSMNTTGSSGSVTIKMSSTVFAASSNTVTKFSTAGAATVSFSSTTEFTSLQGIPSTVSSEVETEFDINSGGTFRNLYVQISANARSTTSTYKSRVNNADGNQAISITAGATGVFEDTSNTDTVSANDDLNYSITQGASGGDLVVRLLASEMETTTLYSHSINSYIPGESQSRNQTRYHLLGGGLFSQTVQADTQAPLGFDADVSNLYLYLSANTVGLASSFKLQSGGSDTALAISITASTSGAFEDTSNTVSVDENDLLNLALVTPNNGTALTSRVAGLMIKDTTPAPPSGTYIGSFYGPSGYF